MLQLSLYFLSNKLPSISSYLIGSHIITQFITISLTILLDQYVIWDKVQLTSIRSKVNNMQ